MIIADTDVLSALAKIGHVSILYELFQRTVLYITPGVFKEIEHSFTRQVNMQSTSSHCCQLVRLR